MTIKEFIEWLNTEFKRVTGVDGEELLDYEIGYIDFYKKPTEITINHKYKTITIE